MKYCPTCYRAGPQMDDCPNKSFPDMPCPEPATENPEKDVSLSCGPCGFARVVPLKDLLSGKAKHQLPRCTRDTCEVKNIAAAPKAKPAAKPTPAPKAPNPPGAAKE